MAQRTLVLVRCWESDGSHSCAACSHNSYDKSPQQAKPEGELADSNHGDYQGLLPEFGSTVVSSLCRRPHRGRCFGFMSSLDAGLEVTLCAWACASK
jgi:hypothetical protein